MPPISDKPDFEPIPDSLDNPQFCRYGFDPSNSCYRLEQARLLSQTLGERKHGIVRKSTRFRRHQRGVNIAKLFTVIVVILIVVLLLCTLTFVLLSLHDSHVKLAARVNSLETELEVLKTLCKSESDISPSTKISETERTRNDDKNDDQPLDEQIMEVEFTSSEELAALVDYTEENDGEDHQSIRDWLKSEESINKIRRRRRSGNRRTSRRNSNKNLRASSPERTQEPNSTEVETIIRGVHFEANLNRTTTIGVGWIPHWDFASSFSRYQDEVHRKFKLHPRGNVTVMESGVYYVYSQVMYYDPNEYIGHSIAVNGLETFTCIAPISSRHNKYRTCFVGGLTYLPARAKVGIKMVYTPRQICLFEDTSYFGMFKVF